MSGWTDENLSRAKTLWAGGDSATQVAVALGRWCTRNAVIGKMSRAGVRGGVRTPGAVARIKARRAHETMVERERARAATLAARKLRQDDAAKARKETYRNPSAQRAARTLLAASTRHKPTTGRLGDAEPVTFLARAFGECAWIVEGEGMDALCCGMASGRGPYCPGHHAVAYVPSVRA